VWGGSVHVTRMLLECVVPAVLLQMVVVVVVCNKVRGEVRSGTLLAPHIPSCLAAADGSYRHTPISTILHPQQHMPA